MNSSSTGGDGHSSQRRRPDVFPQLPHQNQQQHANYSLQHDPTGRLSNVSLNNYYSHVDYGSGSFFNESNFSTASAYSVDAADRIFGAPQHQIDENFEVDSRLSLGFNTRYGLRND